VLRYGKGDAVWTIAQSGMTITTSLDGVDTVETFASEQIAHKRFDILIGKQSREGWKRIKQEPVAPVPRAAPTSPAAIVEDARNAGLEAMITADPGNAEGYRMYADWLEQQGDPRGQLIALMLALEARPTDHKLALMTDRYRDRIRDYILKGVIDRVGCRIHLARGFVNRIEYLQDELAPQLRETLAAPSTRFVTSIQLDDDGTGGLLDALAVVAESAPPTLQRLVFGGRVSLEHLDPIATVLPRLRRLEVFNVHRRQLALSSHALGQLVASPFPKLESLHLDLAPSTRLGDLAPLFERGDLPNLVELGVRSSIDAEILRVLAASPLAKQLTSLSLEHFRNEDIELWRHARPKLPRLQRLAVADPYGWGQAELEAYKAEGLTIGYSSGHRAPPLREAPTTPAPVDDDDAFDDVRE